MPITTLAEAEEAIGALQTALQNLLRKDIGVITLSASRTPPPDCLPCDGHLYDVSQAEYSHLRDLCQTLGATFGGDGVTTFQVPELRGEFVRVWNDGTRADGAADAGRGFGTWQDWATGMPRAVLTTEQTGVHNHGGKTGGQSNSHRHPASASGGSAQGGPNTFHDAGDRGVNSTVQVTIGEADRDHTHTILEDGAHTHLISGGDQETRPRNVALAAYIRFLISYPAIDMPITTLAEAEEAIGALQTALQNLLRKDIGVITLSASRTPPPDCLPCDGHLYDVSQAEYSHLRDLCQTLGATFGGDGVTTFQVPELRGEFVRVWNDGTRADGAADAGRGFGTWQDWATGMPRAVLTTEQTGVHNHGGKTGGQSNSHRHPASASGGSAQGGPNTFDNGDERGVNGTVQVTIGEADRDHTHTILEDGAHTHLISGGDQETRPRNVALAAYIRF